MFNYFNTSLWKQIGKESGDFMEEVKYFRDVNDQVRKFCEPLYRTLRSQPDALEAVLYYRSKRYGSLFDASEI